MASKLPNLVYVADRDENRIAAWNGEDLPLVEPGLDEIVKARRDIRNHTDADTKHILDDTTPNQADDSHSEPAETSQVYDHQNLIFTPDIPEAIRKADIIFICVSTPSEPGQEGEIVGLTLQDVESAVNTIAKHSTGDKIVVVKSTVSCGTTSLIQETVITRVYSDPSIRKR